MSLFSMNQQHGRIDFIDIDIQRKVQERFCSGNIPAVVAVERSWMIASCCFVVGMIVLYKLRRIIGNRIHHSPCSFEVMISEIKGSLRCDGRSFGIAGFL